MAQYDFGPNPFDDANQGFEDWLKYSVGREQSNQAAGMEGVGKGISQFAAQQGGLAAQANTLATQAKNRAAEEELLARTRASWDSQGENIGPLAEAMPEDIYDKRNVDSRAKLRAFEMSEDRDLNVARKNDYLSQSEALAAKRNAETAQIKDFADVNERLKNAQANLAEARASGNMTEYQRQSLEVQRLRAQRQDVGGTWQSTVDYEGNAIRTVVPKNAPIGATLTSPPPATTRSREDMSEVALGATKGLVDRLKSGGLEGAADYASQVGPGIGRLNEGLRLMGVATPEFAHLPPEIRAISQVLVGIHSLRSAEAGRDLERQFSTSQTSEALIAALEGAMVIPQEFVMQKHARGARGGYSATGAAPVTPGPGGGGAVDHGAVVKQYMSGGKQVTIYADGWWE